jgi:hypothetical protein
MLPLSSKRAASEFRNTTPGGGGLHFGAGLLESHLDAGEEVNKLSLINSM